MFVEFIREKAAPENVERIKRALNDPSSGLNHWLGTVEKLSPKTWEYPHAIDSYFGLSIASVSNRRLHKYYLRMLDFLEIWVSEAIRIDERERRAGIMDGVLTAAWGANRPDPADVRSANWCDGVGRALSRLSDLSPETFAEFQAVERKSASVREKGEERTR
jgi:hypothetical protein